MKPARKPATRIDPTVQRKILRLTMMQPRSTYFFFFCSPGPNSQLCCVSSSGRESAALSKSWRFLLRSSSVAESAAFISSGPPHGSLPYMLIYSDSLLEPIHQPNFKIGTQISPSSPSSIPPPPRTHRSSKTQIVIWKRKEILPPHSAFCLCINPRTKNNQQCQKIWTQSSAEGNGVKILEWSGNIIELGLNGGGGGGGGSSTAASAHNVLPNNMMILWLWVGWLWTDCRMLFNYYYYYYFSCPFIKIRLLTPTSPLIDKDSLSNTNTYIIYLFSSLLTTLLAWHCNFFSFPWRESNTLYWHKSSFTFTLHE